MPTHKAVATTQLGVVDTIEVPTAETGHGEVLMKVEYSSLIPFDTYMSDLGFFVEGYPTVVGFNASGTVAKLGTGVDDLSVGDRIASFTFMKSKGMQEYTVQPRVVCSKIPDTISLAEAATIPDNLVTAFYTLFNQLRLPIPSSFPATIPPPNASTPILIYGAGSTSGQYMVQLLSSAGYKKIIATASKARNSIVKFAQAVGSDGLVALAVDCIGTETTMASIAEVISPIGTVGILLPTKKGSKLTVNQISDFGIDITGHGPFVKTVNLVGVRTFQYLNIDAYLKENLMPKFIPLLLASGIIKPSRVRLMDQGSFKERVEKGMDLLRNNKISGEKVVVEVPL